MTNSRILARTVRTILGLELDAVVLAPGALVALRLFLQSRGASVLLISDREYYGPSHFPGLKVQVAPFERIPSVAEDLRPDAVLASVVSWTGRREDVGWLDRELGSGGSQERPLFCLDWCQAGAAGFPPLGDLGADLIIGDATKWLIPAGTPDRIAFVAAGPRVRGVLPAAFGGLYLSGGCRTDREARWVDPHSLAEVTRSLTKSAPDRSRIAEWHAENMALARTVAERNGLEAPGTALLWLPGRTPEELDLERLPSQDLAWALKSGVRIQCQASP